MSDRSEYTKGLRQLADILDNNPELPLPYDGNGTEMLWIRVNGGQDKIRDDARLFARLIPGDITKSARGGDFDLTGRISGLNVQMIVTRDAVCERVVTGTREVTIEATPAMPATEAQPERTETVEDVEWVCGSLLADAVTA